MKKIIIPLILILFMFPLNVFADDIDVEPETEIITEVQEESTETEPTEINEDLIQNIEVIKNTLIGIEYIGLFAVMLHYSEKWMRIMVDANRNSGRL